MPKRITRGTVVLTRNGKRVVPTIGKLFDYTADELDKINKLNPNAVAKPQEAAAEFIDANAKSKTEAELKAEEEAAAKAEADAKAKAEADAKAKAKGTALSTKKADDEL